MLVKQNVSFQFGEYPAPSVVVWLQSTYLTAQIGFNVNALLFSKVLFYLELQCSETEPK
jgi:hypothetical protein